MNSPSKASLWREWINNIAFSHLVLEQNFEEHKKEVYERIKNLKPGSALWYRNKALEFKYGFALFPDSDVFNTKSAKEEEIEKAQIIKYSAVTEAVNESRLIIKIATEKNGVLAPITKAQQEAFTAYINEIKFAGVRTTIINYLPDILRLKMEIYRDPLVLDENGTSVLTGKKPVEDTINEFMKKLPFNGELILAGLVDKLQLVEGVKIPHIVAAASQWIDGESKTYGDFEEITVKKIPVSGYFSIENFDNIRYVV